MESLIYNIISHIKDNMPTIAVVDENYGQIESICNATDDNMYPLTFPAVLVDLQEVVWTPLKQLIQRGEARVNVQLLIDCYDDTHYGSDSCKTVDQRAKMANELHRCLQGFMPCGDSAMRRESSKFYTVTHGIKIYETVYVVRLLD